MRALPAVAWIVLLGCLGSHESARDGGVDATARDAGARDDATAGDAGARDDSGSDAPDAPRLVDASAPDPDAGPDVPPPRPIAPLSTSHVGRARPLLRWQRPPGVDMAEVTICRDRACATIEGVFTADADAMAVPFTLAPGVHFWRLRGMAAGFTGRSASPVWELVVGHGDAPADTSWGTIPDYDGDGVADVAVGFSHTDGAPGDAVYVYLGRAGAFPTSPDVSLTMSRVSTVANVGDVDGDGFADLAVRRVCADASGRDTVEIHFGGPGGPASDAGVILRGTAGGCLYGRSVIALGDADGDGYGDIVVEGLEPAALGGFGTRMQVFAGSPAGPVAVASSSIDGGGEWNTFGPPVAAGDIDADGFADLAIPESPGWALGRPFPGSVRVFRGSAAGISAASEVVLSSPVDRDLGFGLVPDGPADFDGDGAADLVVDARAWTDGSTNLPRRVYVFRGGPTFWAGPPPAAVLPSPTDPGFFGPGGGTAGDVDADGFDDLVLAEAVPGGSLVQVARGGAAGLVAFEAPTTLTPEVYTYAVPARRRDLDADGFDDLLLRVPTGSLGAGWGVAVLRGGAAGLASSPAATLSVPMSSGSATWCIAP